MANEHDNNRPDLDRLDALMPWVRRGQLDKDERELISDDLATSPEFFALVAEDETLATELEDIALDEAEQSSRDDDAAWANFLKRPDMVESLATPEPEAQKLRPRPKARTSSWRTLRLPKTSLGWLATAQTAALAAVAFAVIPGLMSQNEEPYRTLSSDAAETPATPGNAVLMLAPSTDQNAMRDVLEAANARIVDGPMANGAYVIALKADGLEESLAALRANEAVVLAEPLEARELQP